MLDLWTVSKRLGGFHLDMVDLRVEGGEFFVLLGPSGVGKTVLIEIIAGLIEPDEGHILWDGEDITNAPPEARGFAVVYQDLALFPHMSVAGNIAYGLRAKGAPHDEAQRGVRSLAEMLRIVPLLERRPETLSGGEQQRVALARALAPGPRLLLLDEPLSALDLNIRLGLQRELKRIQKETGTTFLHVTHDLDEAMFMGDRVGVMLDGRVRQVGPPEELFRRPTDREVADFLGMRNILSVECSEPGICRAGGLEIHAAAADEGVSHVWIKPEEIVLSKAPFDSSARNQFKCRVRGWEARARLLAVTLETNGVELTALITHASFEELGVAEETEYYCTFKSSAVHCF